MEWIDYFSKWNDRRRNNKFIENIHDANDEKYLKKIFLSGIETTLKATNDKELENRIKNFSNF